MDVAAVIKWSVFLALGIAVLVFQVFVHLPKHWTGQTRDSDELSWRNPLGLPDLKTGFRRLPPANILIGIGFTLGCSGALWSEVAGSRELTGLPLVLTLVACVSFLLYIPLHYLVIYRNRPKFLVAPHYRDDRSVVQIRRDEGRLWRSRWRLLRNVLLFIAFCGALVFILLLVRR